jgi:ATP/maltotriose-dependent transcriptional regulator MalT
MLGQVARGRGDLERATAYLEGGVARLRAAGEPWLAASYLTNVGVIALERGDLERAAACCEESLSFARRTGADFVAATALAGLADVARRRGDLADAKALGREQLLAWRRLNAPAHLAESLEGLALTAAAAGEDTWAERSARLLGAAAVLRERVGTPPSSMGQAYMEQLAVPARAALGEERWAAAFAAGRGLSLEEAIAEALDETG